jgi:hypothetical protein
MSKKKITDPEGEVTGPKGLKSYGSSYVYSIFKRFGLV